MRSAAPVPGCPMFTPETSRSRSPASRMSRSPTRARASPASRPNTSTSRVARACAVAGSNRSVANSSRPSRPPPSGRSRSTTDRSNFEEASPTGTASAPSPGAANAVSGAFWRAKATWKSGCLASERTGFRTSTRCSKGRS